MAHVQRMTIRKKFAKSFNRRSEQRAHIRADIEARMNLVSLRIRRRALQEHEKHHYQNILHLATL